MSRLTKRAENGAAVYATPSGDPVKWENNRNKVLRKLAEYEDLEEQELLLKLPCKVGSTIYQLINSHIYEYKVIGICFDILHNKWMYEVAYEIGLEWFKTMCDFDVFSKSKTVFLTREEAEKALKEMESAE